MIFRQKSKKNMHSNGPPKKVIDMTPTHSHRHGHTKGGSHRTSTGPPNAHHSQALSCYCTTWGLLAAGFPPWPGTPLLRERPGDHQSSDMVSMSTPCLARTPDQHVQTKVGTPSVDGFRHPASRVAGLQAHATTPSRLRVR